MSSLCLAPVEDVKDDVQLSADLSAPQLNSTTQVLKQLNALKNQQRTSTLGPSNGELETYLPSSHLSTLHGGPRVGGLEEMPQRPYKVSQQIWMVMSLHLTCDRRRVFLVMFHEMSLGTKTWFLLTLQRKASRS